MDLNLVREKFPALKRDEIFFDNPGGTQVCQECLDRISTYLIDTNSNKHGPFPTSAASDQTLQQVRDHAAAFFNASRYEEIVFGQNMTSLTYNLSRAIANRLQPGDSIAVTRLDHDANITPWVTIAEERGCQVEWVDFDVETGRLQMDSWHKALESKPKLTAFGYASNALGTISPVEQMTKEAKSVGALTFIDAVQFAPHGLMDVQNLDCDFMAVSAYKFFGPHVGMLYGKFEHLESLSAYQLRPAPQTPPGVWERGTQNHEGMAGVLGAFEHLYWLAEKFTAVDSDAPIRLKFDAAMKLIASYELDLSRSLQEQLESISGAVIFGITDPNEFADRVPTFSLNLQGYKPRELAEKLGQVGINSWSGNYYAVDVTVRLGLEESGGMLRIGAAHYNTLEEVETLGRALRKISGK